MVYRLSRLLTARRITLHLVLLAACLWSLYAIDLATPGLRDRAGHLKGADFVHFYTGGYLARTGGTQAIYDPPALAAAQQALVPDSQGGYFVASYGPQVYLAFAPLTWLPYEWATIAWALMNGALYFFCCYALWRTCPGLGPHPMVVFLAALAFPGFFNLIAYGQTSGPALVLFTLAFLAMRSRRMFLAGLAIGSLIYKPQLGIAAAVVLLMAAEWRAVAGAIAAAAAQLAIAWRWFGGAAVEDYFHSLLRTGQALPFIEPRVYQMHSLRGFWLLLLPWRGVAFFIYVAMTIGVLALALRCWRSGAGLSLRYAALLFATVLAAPHLMVYDLVVLVPAFLLLADWALEHAQAAASPALRVLLYLGYALPLLEMVAKYSRVQLSVVGFAALLITVWSASREQTGALAASPGAV